MMKIYLDNAATTALDDSVLSKMLPYMSQHYGNPSSIHGAGRTTRLAIEESRKTVANLLDCHPAEIFFTSCGTESTNTILQAAIRSLDCKYFITSPIEHHATLTTAEKLCAEFDVALCFVDHFADGHIDFTQLESLISSCSAKGRTFVSVMHANNEIGTINDIERIGNLCEAANAFFHSDMVQTVGHLPVSLQSLKVHFASASAHKFHGPKGSGVLYIDRTIKIDPFIVGGGQERNMRAGTENVPAIVGFTNALELAIAEMKNENMITGNLKEYCWQQLKSNFPDILLNGSLDQSLPRVLNVLMPLNNDTEMLQMSLDIKGIAISGGSACSSGALGGSHVINHIASQAGIPLRISFCKWNTTEEIDYLIKSMIEILH